MYYAYWEDCLTFVHFREPHCIEDIDSSISLRILITDILRHYPLLAMKPNYSLAIFAIWHQSTATGINALYTHYCGIHPQGYNVAFIVTLRYITQISLGIVMFVNS